MELQLIASMPGKRFDPCRTICADGRGGWVFSQVNVDRTISIYHEFQLLFCLGVLVKNALECDYVEATRLTARMEDQDIGSDELAWRQPNSMWGYQNGSAIFEWVQSLTMKPEKDGLIAVQIEAKLNSRSDWIPVNGNAFCRIARAGSNERPKLDRRFVSPLAFTLRNLFQKPFWPGKRG